VLFAAESIALALSLGLESFRSRIVAESLERSPGNPDRFIAAAGLANLVSALAWGLPVSTPSEYAAVLRRSGLARRSAALGSAATFGAACILYAAYAQGLIASPATVSGMLLLALAGAEWLHTADFGLYRTLRTCGTADRFFWLSAFASTLFLFPVWALPVCTALWLAQLALRGKKSGAWRLILGALRERSERSSTAREENPAGSDFDDFPVSGARGVLLACEPKAPLYAGVLPEIERAVTRSGGYPAVLLIGLRHVLYLDDQGIATVAELWSNCRKQGCVLLIAEIHTQPYMMLAEQNLDESIGEDRFFGTFNEAFAYAAEHYSCSL